MTAAAWCEHALHGSRANIVGAKALMKFVASWMTLVTTETPLKQVRILPAVANYDHRPAMGRNNVDAEAVRLGHPH